VKFFRDPEHPWQHGILSESTGLGKSPAFQAIHDVLDFPEQGKYNLFL
jgi:hypothetical protein